MIAARPGSAPKKSVMTFGLFWSNGNNGTPQLFPQDLSSDNPFQVTIKAQSKVGRLEKWTLS